MLSELLTKLTANSGWAWRGVGKACWKRENAARSTLKSNAGRVTGASEGDKNARMHQVAIVVAIVATIATRLM